MKNILKNILLLAAAAFFAGILSCNNDTNPVEPAPVIVVNPADSTVKGTLTLSERPTDWKPAEDGSYTSMCVKVGSDGVPAVMDSTDMLSAFIDTECRGVASPILDNSGKMCFYITVTAPDSQSVKTVELRYYSAVEKGIFTSKPFEYSAGGIVGVYKRFVPDWK